MEALLSWQTVMFSVAVWIIVFLIRRVAELARPTLKFRPWWRNGVLVVLPPVLGVLLVLVMPTYSWPELLQSRADKILTGLCCGFFCGWTYKLVKGLLRGKLDAVRKSVVPDTPTVTAPVIPEPTPTPIEPVNDNDSLRPPAL